MNKEQEALLGEAYEGYVESYSKGNSIGIQLDDGTERVANIDEFIRRIRQDIPFAEKWGLKFEKRELSLDERVEYYCSQDWVLEHLKDSLRKQNPEQKTSVLYVANTPTKLITITYNDKTIESYE
jgi:hypothetical protein